MYVFIYCTYLFLKTVYQFYLVVMIACFTCDCDNFSIVKCQRTIKKPILHGLHREDNNFYSGSDSFIVLKFSKG